MLELGIIFFIIGIALFLAESTESSFFRYAVAQTETTARYNTRKQRHVYHIITTICLLAGFVTLLVA